MPRRVLLVRPDHNSADAAALCSRGWDVVVEPWLQVRPVAGPDARRLLAAVAQAKTGDLLVFTSPRTWVSWAATVGADVMENAVREAVMRGMSVAAVGSRTAGTLPTDLPVVLPDEPSAAGLVAHLSALPTQERPRCLLLPGSSIARDELAHWGVSEGMEVLRGTVYETVALPERPAHADAVTAGHLDAIVLRSPSAAQAVALFAQVPDAMMVVAVGPSTARSAQSLGGRLIELPVVTAEELADTMESIL